MTLINGVDTIFSMVTNESKNMIEKACVWGPTTR